MVRRYNARLGQSPNRDPGVTPVQRQGYPSVWTMAEPVRLLADKVPIITSTEKADLVFGEHFFR